MAKGDVLSVKGGRVLIIGAAEVETLPEGGGFLTLSKDIELLRKVMRQVYDINERKGPGSRKAVRDLLMPYLKGTG